MSLIIWLRTFSLSSKLTLLHLFCVVFVSAAFTQDSYEVDESDAFVEVCVVLQSLPDDLAEEVVIYLTATDGNNDNIILLCLNS